MPAKSRDTRRRSLSLDSRGDCDKLSDRSFDSTKESIGFEILPAARFSLGMDGLLIVSKDQWSVHLAPSRTHLVSVSICFFVRALPSSGGGMTSSRFSVAILRINSLSTSLPATTGVVPDSSWLKTDSFRSILSPAFSLPASGPWQVKQCSDRMGRISRSNSIIWPAAIWLNVNIRHVASDKDKGKCNMCYTGRMAVAYEKPCGL